MDLLIHRFAVSIRLPRAAPARPPAPCQSESRFGHLAHDHGFPRRSRLCFALSGYFSSADQNPAAFARDSARTTNLCESSRPRRSLRERRLPASCVPHGAPSGFATFTPAWSSRLSVPSPLISLLSSTERGMRPVRRSRRSGLPPGACAGQGSHHRPPRRHTGFSALPCRFAASASRHPSSPRYSGRVCMCIPLSVLPILLSVLQRVACLPNRPS